MDEIITIQPSCKLVEKDIFINNDVLLQNFIKYLQVSEKTACTYISRLKQFFKWLEKNNISEPNYLDLLNYKEYLEKNFKPTTTQISIISIKNFFSYLEFMGLYKDIAKGRIFKSLKISKEHKKEALTKDQLDNLFNIIDTSTEKGKRDISIIKLAYVTGLRVSEIANIKITDIENKGDFTIVRVLRKGRNEKSKKVIPPRTYGIICEYLKAKEPTEYLFTSISNHDKGKKLTARSLNRIIKEYFKKIGLNNERFTFHSLRHTTATQSLLKGNTLQETMELMGHRSIDTTLIYSHNINELNNKATYILDEDI